jgi:hypothetical protein
VTFSLAVRPHFLYYTYSGWRFTRRPDHGVADKDIVHALTHQLAAEELGEEPERWLIIGPDRAANLLELVVLTTVEGDRLVIHAMRMRAQYRRLLDP